MSVSEPKRRQLVRNAISAACQNGQQFQLDEVLWFFIEHAGGARGFAKLLHDEYHSAKAGTVVRQRILDTLLRLGQFVETRRPKQADVDTLTEEDLYREIAKATEKLSENETDDGEQSAA